MESDFKSTNLRIIKTARTEKAINKAAKTEFWPLIKPVKPNPKIKTKFAVFQNTETGEIEVMGDYRSMFRIADDKYKKVIDFTFHYPYNFPSPYAAYLIPKDIVRGEKVWLEDLIEDLIGRMWNQGDVYRLESAEAIWNGEDFEILYDEKKDSSFAIG